MSRRNTTSYRYSADFRKPGEGTSAKRGRFTLILCILLPPLGLLYLWRMGVFRKRGRIVLTALVTAEMLVLALNFLPRASLQTVRPTPGQSAAVTKAPESEVKTALYNIDELLKAEQAASGELDQQESSSVITDEIAAQQAEAQEELYNTVVYAFNGSGTRFYHAVPECNGQKNDRQLTLREAMSEGLGACRNCNPPTLSGG